MTSLRSASSRLVVLGLVALTLGFSLWCIQVTAFERSRFERAAGDLAVATAVRQSLADDVATATMNALGPDSNVDEVVVRRAAEQAVGTPIFINAFTGTVAAIHAHMVDGASDPIVVDGAVVNRAMRDALAATSPADATALSPNQPLPLTITGLPNLSSWVRLIRGLAPTLALLGVVLISTGIAGAARRARLVGRVGRWILVVGAVTLVGGVLLPVTFESSDGWLGVIGLVVGADRPLLVPSLLLVAIGAACAYGAHLWEDHERHHTLASVPSARPVRGGTGSPWESPV